MKISFWHRHQWVGNESGDVRTCAICGETQYLGIVGFDDPHYDWDSRGVPCKICKGTGKTLDDKYQVIPCKCDNGYIKP